MGLLAYSTILVGGAAVYSSYSTARNPDEGGYLFGYLLGFAAMLMGLIFGISSLLNGEFISGGVALIVGITAIGIVVSITVFGFAKKNPEGAVAAASAVAGAAAAADELSDSKKNNQTSKSKDKSRVEKSGKEQVQDMKMKNKLKRASFKMNCPSCGQTWAFNDEGIVSGDDRIGYNYIGYDDVLERTEIQCSNCGTTKKVDRKI